MPLYDERGAAIDVLDVPLMVAKGYSSKTYAFGAARDIADELERLKRIYIYHLGDSDPSGEDAARDCEVKLRRYTSKTAFRSPRGRNPL